MVSPSRAVVYVTLGVAGFVACSSYATSESAPDGLLDAATDAPAVVDSTVVDSAVVDSAVDVAEPAEAGPPAVVVQVALGSRFTCARLASGRVKCWGYNAFGQLGIGDQSSRGIKPGEMGSALAAVDLGGHTAKHIAAGNANVCAILDDDSVRCWGANNLGQLGAGIGLGAQVYRGDSPGEMGTALPSVDFGVGRRATQIAVGGSHACALVDDGSVQCWGYNEFGQVGRGDRAVGPLPSRVDLGVDGGVRAIDAAHRSSCALLGSNRLKCWGLSNAGQLGIPAVANPSDPGYARGDDAGEMGAALLDFSLRDAGTIQRFALGCFHGCAVFDDGRVKCWGYNTNGQLGLGDVRLRDGSDGGPLGDALPFVMLGDAGAVSDVTSGCYHTCTLSDGRAKCWGNNTDGELGTGDRAHRGSDPAHMGDKLPFVVLGASRVAAIVPSRDTGALAHTCALLEGGRLKCWGNNNEGQLGLGDTLGRGDAPTTVPFIDLGTE